MTAGLEVWTRAEAGRHLRRAFPAFLGRFPSLTEIQAHGMPKVFEGRDLVLMGPAASGKTEAVMAPLCERLLETGEAGSLRILYCVPTRALANDTEVRISEPCGALGLKVMVRTGDRPKAPEKERPDVLVTTPESFDSLLCRWPEGFRSLLALVVDEAHLLSHSPRGDQMGILVRRLLRFHVGRRPQMIAMSATIGDPKLLGFRLFGHEVMVVQAGAKRPIETVFANDIKEALFLLRAYDLSKALIFCNSRRDAEAVAKIAAAFGAWPPERVMVHHASLSRREREEVEQAFRYFRAGLMICTTTLEVGIDIGDVDAVVLYGPPPDVESFYQRVGRGCRRRQGMLAICVPMEAADVPIFEAIVQEVEAGLFSEMPWEPDLGVIVQQTFSLLYGRRQGLERQRVLEVLEPLAPPDVIEEVLEHLIEEGFVEYGPMGRLIASEKVMEMGERGRIHSNISEDSPFEVRVLSTGRTLGQIGGKVECGSVFGLGGRHWRVVRVAKGVVFVEPSSGNGSATFARHKERSPFCRYLPPKYRKKGLEVKE